MAQTDFKRVVRTSTFGWLFAGLLALTAAVNCGDDDDDGVTGGSGGRAGSAGTGGSGTGGSGTGGSGTGGAGGAGGTSAQGATVAVTANYAGSANEGKFYWALLPDAGGMPGAPPIQFGTPTPTFPGSFAFSIPNVAPGSYFVGAFIDTTGLGEPLPTDPQDFLPVTVAAGQTSVTVTLNLVANTGGGGGGAGGAGGAGGQGGG